MKKSVIYLAVVLAAVVAFCGIYFLNLNTDSARKETSTIYSDPPKTTTLKNIKKASDYFFPLPDYFSRTRVKHFGQLIRASDKFDVPCGAEFSGLHDGEDLEVTDAEKNTEVPVHAVAAGKVLQVGHVSGYGGLLVQSAVLNGEDVTVYYGHINYQTAGVKSGENVTPGEVLAFLGKGCSGETDGERKHLHFAIHRGTNVDVRGYVPSESVLQNWLNPGEMLKSLNASESKSR